MSKRRRFPFVIILRDARVLLLTLLLLLMLLGPRQTTGLMNSASEATSLPGHSFSHMELYELGGEEFLAIAQTNELINLRADFTAKYVTRTGPRNDSLTCSPNQILLTVLDINRQCQVHPMDNYMKAMTLYNGNLYFCMSYLSSSCAAVHLTDGPLVVDFAQIDRKLKHLSRSLLCRSESAKTHLTVAPKYTDLDSNIKHDGLYLSMPFCTTKNLDNTVESIMSIVDMSSLQLFRFGTFSRFSTEILPHSSKSLPNTLAYHYSFKYTDGPHEYVYYLLTAREVVESELSQVRIGRLCTRDLYLTGYVEMHIYCNHADADATAIYGFTGEAATFGRAGSQLAAQLGIPAEEPVLFLSSRVVDSSLLNWRQGVCAVPISVINSRLNRIVADCLNGQAYFGPAYIRDHVKCSARQAGRHPSSSSSSTSGGEEAAAPKFCTPFQSQPEWMGMVGLKEQHRYQTSFLASVSPSQNITSLAVLPLDNGATVLYIGTSGGQLLQYRVQDSRDSWLFANASVDNGPVLAIRTGKRRLYTLGRTLAASHPYASCERLYRSCSACLGSRNPHCVWSNQEGSAGCQTWDRPGLPSPASHVTLVDNCPTVVGISNSEICIDDAAKLGRVFVDMQIRNAPPVAYFCHYVANNATGHSMAALPAREAELRPSYQGGSLGVSCPVDLVELGSFLGNQASRSLAVQIASSRSSSVPYYASANVEAFSCRLHTDCTSCVAAIGSGGGGSRRLCSWCSLRSACVHRPADDCPGDVGRSAVVNSSQGGVSDGSCPLISSADGVDVEIALASGTAARLLYDFSGYQQAFMKSFSCTVACQGGEPAEFPASLLESHRRQLRCSTGLLQAGGPAATVACSVAFHWSDQSGRKRALESAGSAGRLLIYRCQAMASSCDDCTLGIRDQRFQCVWCSGGGGDGACAAADHCSATAVQRGGLCAGPLLRRIQPPKLAPYAGLRLSVEGSNLGNSWESLAVLLQPEPGRLGPTAKALSCAVQAEAYTPGKAFNCLLAGSPLLGTRYRLLVSLPSLTNSSHAANVATGDWLSVAKPALVGLEGSAKAQLNGRAEVALLGSDLDAGSDLQVTMLSDQFLQVPAEVLSRASDRVTVRLGRFHNPGLYFASLTLQGQPESKLAHRPAQLDIVPDAELSVVPPESARRTGLIPAGGLAFELPGARLDAVRLPLIELRQLDEVWPEEAPAEELRQRRLVGECRAVQSTLLICTSPPLPTERRLKRSPVAEVAPPSDSADIVPKPTPSWMSAKPRFSATIYMDSLAHRYPANLTLFPDPEMHQAGSLQVQLHPDWRRLEPGPRELQLSGRHLRPGLLLSDISVWVGPLACHVAALQSLSSGDVDLLTCRHQLPDSAIDVKHPITASIGRLHFSLGHVTYAAQFNWNYVYLTIPGVLALLFVSLVAFLVHSHRRKRRRQEKDNRIEVQINLLEAQVSQNCRDAFAELQLNSSGAGDRLGATDEWLAPVPVRSFAEFASFSCFAERYQLRHQAHDPLFSDVMTPEAAAAALAAEPPEVRRALSQLHNLLLNEDFLLIMIATMESRPDSFSIQERNHFGSLLSALLYYDIGYFTRILSRLIQRLVVRRQETNDNYKVVFRRCDSVAERLLPNWLAFLMYEHLNSQVAGPLHRLYCSMRQQIYSGPVDQISGNSKYTINEQKLLKKEIAFKEIILTFQDRLRLFSAEQQQLQCSVCVLDCDTVHQAKEKILDAVYTRLELPYSQRVPASQFDLARTFRGTAGLGGGLGGIREENSNERYLILTEVDNSHDSGDGIERLRRLDSFKLGEDGVDQCGDNEASAIVVFLKPRKELPSKINGATPASALSLAATVQRRAKGGTLAGISDFSSSQQASCSSSWRSLPDGTGSGSRGGKLSSRSAAPAAASEPAEKRRYHLEAPSGAESQSLLGGSSADSGKKKQRRKNSSKRGRRGDSSEVTPADGQQIVSEVFYPVLLKTKRLLTDTITDLFSALFPAPKSEQLQPEQDKEVPLCIKYLFDLFDHVVAERQLTHDVAHIWKSNALMLRFYTNHLFNVDYLLDVEVALPVRCCMSTVSSLFVDACSFEKPAKPDKTSTAQRLLFVNEVMEFHPLVEAYYRTVRYGFREAETYALSQFEQQVRNRQSAPFNRDALLRELFTCFVYKYREEMIRELQRQQPNLSASLSDSLEFVYHVLSNASPYWSKAHTLSSNHSQSSVSTSRLTHATIRPNATVFNPYEPTAC